MNIIWIRVYCVLIFIGFLTGGCSIGSRGLDKMIEEGRYDEVIELVGQKIEQNPEDHALYIVAGDAYYRKAMQFNADRGAHYTPEAAALAKKAIGFYEKSKQYRESMRVDQKISNAGTLTSPC
jgi:hypothetical protein